MLEPAFQQTFESSQHQHHQQMLHQQHQHPSGLHQQHHLLDTSFHSNLSGGSMIGGGSELGGEDYDTISNLNYHCPRTSSISSSTSSGAASAWLGYLDSPAAHLAATRIGYARCLQIFFFHSSNLLLNRNNMHKDKIKNVACFVLEIYKMFIRKIKMDHYTWYDLCFVFFLVVKTIFNN